MAEIDERVVALQSRIFAAGFKVPAVLREAEVDRHTWARMSRGESYRTSTLTKISKALDAMIANPQQETTHGS